MHGRNFIGWQLSRGPGDPFRAVNPASGEDLEPEFADATDEEIGRAVELAERAFDTFRELSVDRRAEFLNRIAGRIEEEKDLLARAGAETGLPQARLTGERGRTVNQIRMFAELVTEGSWLEARIDRALPDRQPAPRPDLRRMLIPIGPVAVFGASNFPLAFSVTGGDTASALAAGCPVVVKAHPAHPGTSELVASGIVAAARETGMPEGVFSLVHGQSNRVGMTLVTHPSIRAVGFTGSFQGGRALFDAAASRPEPIPVFAEMGSVNPVFMLPGAIEDRGERIALDLVASVTLGSGQFCTNPGLTILPDTPGSEVLLGKIGELISQAPAGTAVHSSIKAAYDVSLLELSSIPGVEVAARSTAAGTNPATVVTPALLVTDARTFGDNPLLSREVFGPSTLVVKCASEEVLYRLAGSLPGQLTATIQAADRELAEHTELIRILEKKVGRLIFNDFPTGVEVCPSMQHGGPYPATTAPGSTSVGTAAIRRFTRPICYQNFPEESLPLQLRDRNPARIWRLIDGEPVK